ncbi:MAG: RluA family pseudouridine synthase [Candidatus Omnitrophota bacterium]
MQKLSFTINEEDAGDRLDRFLARMCSDEFSRSFIKKMIDSGCVTVNGKVEKPHQKVRPGEIVAVNVPESKPPESALPEDIPVDIVYEDDDVVVVNKAAGMVTHPAPGNYTGTLVNALLYRCSSLSSVGGQFRPGVVHRIDKDTSGLVVIAKNDKAHRWLAKQFKNRRVKKIYAALVQGIVQLDNGIIDVPIARSKTDRKRMGVAFVESKPAVTKYHVVKRYKDFTRLELELETGRTHQIRVHMSYLGHPLLGDRKYGARACSLARHALHAKQLGFKHPATKRFMEYESALPDDIKDYLEKYEKKDH